VCWPLEITLARRELMGFRMLLGRQAMSRRFIIDPARSYLAGVLYSPLLAAEAEASERKTRGKQ
jgi:hypothetical protein